MIQVGLFVPCFIDQFFPEVAWATVHLLQRFGCHVVFPREQTCCGQPMANSGCAEEAALLADRFVRIFSDPRFDYVVAPSGSCVAMVRQHYRHLLKGSTSLDQLRRKSFELCEFLVDVLKANIDGAFPYRVGLHHSCHGLRELRLGSASELVEDSGDKVRSLLSRLRDITFCELERPDECCGFGGVFAIEEEAVSCLMGNDRIDDHVRGGAEVMVATDMSCLMHMRGLMQRRKVDLPVKHVAQVLVEGIGVEGERHPSSRSSR